MRQDDCEKAGLSPEYCRELTELERKPISEWPMRLREFIRRAKGVVPEDLTHEEGLTLALEWFQRRIH